MITKEGYKRLLHFFLWCIVGFIIAIIGISGVFADSYDGSNFSAQLYDNLGPTLNAVSTNFESSDNSYYGFINLIANSSGGAWGISSPTPLLANHTYTMSAEVYTTGCGSVILSTYNRIGVGTTLSNARSSYMNDTYVNENYSNSTAYNILQFAFTPTINASHIVFAYSSTSGGSNCTSALKSVAFQDLGSSGVSETTINNSLNNQTNIINNSITASTNTITENSDNNRQAIIDNQNANNDALIENDNSNTNKIIEENKKNFNDCRDSYNLFNPNNVENGYVSDNTGGLGGVNSSNKNTGYIEINANTKYFILANKTNGNWGAFYDASKNYISGIKQASFSNGKTIIESPQNAKYLRFTVSYNNNNTDYSNNVMIAESSTELEYEQYGEEICTNKLDETKDAINDVNDTLKDDNVDDNGVADAFESFNDYLDDNSTITQLITLPITLYTAILNNLNGTCSPFNLGDLYGESLVLPCINISQYLGNSLWTMIDIIISGFAVYAISKKMIKVFNNFSSLREGDVIDD